MSGNGKVYWPMVVAGAAGVLVLVTAAWFLLGGPEWFVSWYSGVRYEVADPSSATPGPAMRLSPLAPEPDWAELQRFADTLTVAEFREARERVYGDRTTPWDGWLSFSAEPSPAAQIAFIAGDPAGPRLSLSLQRTALPPRFWREASQLPASTDSAARPLEGVKVALDPGHIGGQWARMEGRWYQPPGEGTSVMEGEMTLAVARLLKPSLEALGATVSMLRDATEPVTAMRPGDFGTQTTSQSQAELFFYRKAEIRARAVVVNEQVRPDLVVCLHFNAEPWGDPGKIEFVAANHLHLIVNGHYDADELGYEDVRFEMLLRLLQRTDPEELRLADAVSRSLASATRLPAYDYDRGHMAGNAHKPLPDNPYVWARNLMANRLYQCPVIYCEPYVMNNREIYDRVAAGDYPGEKLVAGQMRKSLFREYADAVAEGLRAHFTTHRAAR